MIDLRTIRPLDKETIIKFSKKTNRIITVEEGWGVSGIGSEICSKFVEKVFDYLDAEPNKNMCQRCAITLCS